MATSTQAVTFGGFKDIEEKQFYERTLLQPSREEHVLDKFTEKYPLPKNHGKTWSVRKPCRIVAPDSVLTEGVIPAPNDFAMEEYVASIQNYGDYIKFSDESQLYSVDSMKAVLTDEMGYSFKDFLEGKRYQLFTSSKNRWYAGLTTVPTTQTEAGYKAAITKKGIVLDDLRKIAAFFQRNRVRGGKGSSFVFLVSPEILAETRTLTKTAEGGEYTFIELMQQQQADIIYTNAEGKILNFTFVSTNAITPDDDGYYKCLVLGKVNGKWGTIEISLEGSNTPQMMYKDFGSAGTLDPLDQVATIGWALKGYGGAVLYDEAVMVYVCKSDFSYTELSSDNRSSISKKVTFTQGTGTSTDSSPDKADLNNGGALKAAG